jgi:16S rRNA A1518/A1519 N6-dimethyltransferase RsmA/KsgA/DIM1 with predicted DNA glycosylase/AP lyase activity
MCEQAQEQQLAPHSFCKCCCCCSIPKEKYFPVPGVDGALVTFKLLPPSKRVQVQGEKGFITLVRAAWHVATWFERQLAWLHTR